VAKFNVTKIAPDGFLHHMGFNEVIDSLAWSLSALGHDVNVTQNWLSEHGEHNIVFGAELMADFQRLPPNSTIFNLEQPSHPHMEKVRRLAKDIRVWDYSARAVEEWKAAGHSNVHHVPIGYTPNLTRIPHATNQDIDVLFCGWLTPRRVGLLDELRRQGLNVAASAAAYGGGRDNLISRSKVVLDVHHDGRDRFVPTRCVYAMANSKLVVTEISSDDDEYADLANGLSRAPYRMLVDTCRSYCAPSTNIERAKMERYAFEAICRRDFTTAVAAALDSSPSTPAISRPMAFRMERKQHQQEFLREARELKKPDTRVQMAYSRAHTWGDMRDFAGWIRDHAKGNCMEIGVREGMSTAAFLSGIESSYGHLYSVDIVPCGHLFEGHPNWTFIQADSKDYQTVIKQIPFELDLLLIDGDHSRVGVEHDIEYLRQLRPGGMAMFHDISPEPNSTNDPTWPGDDVKLVYDRLCVKLGEMGWTHEEIPGRYGMGVLKRPLSVVKEAVREDSVPV
jgi:predicted O-methyltransferase YrrM